MILADTSVWIDHLHRPSSPLMAALKEGSVLMHPFIIGELACGNLRDRSLALGWLGDLPAAARAADAEVLRMIEDRRLMGRGIGFVDVHLLASAQLSNASGFWTLDRRLAAVARELGV